MADADQEHERALVAAALRAVGLDLSSEEVAAIADGYPELRAMVELLYGVDGAVDELPERIVDA